MIIFTEANSQRSLRNVFWVAALIGSIAHVCHGISIPFFGSLRASGSTTTTNVPFLQRGEEARIINADHGLGLSASIAGGSLGSPLWISGARDPLIRDRFVSMHPEYTQNRNYWQESEFFRPEATTPTAIARTVAKSSAPSMRMRKVPRKSKQQHEVTREIQSLAIPEPQTSNPSADHAISSMPHEYYEVSGIFFRDANPDPVEHMPVFHAGPEHPIFFPMSTYNSAGYSQFPFAHNPRASSQALPPEAVIQFLKSPEQELNTLTRPQVKLPFPLSHDCASGSGTKPLQFVVLPIVEPVAPLKPVIPKPPFLSSQYGQFPYIPPFNMFTKPTPQNVADNNPTGGGSGQFVPILNRPAPPLPFVFVQSLPLELIGQNVEMDILHSPSTQESKIKEPHPNMPVPVSVDKERVPSGTKPLPLIVIEKVKGPGQPPSPPKSPLVPPGVSPTAAVEISKQSIQKNSGSPPLSTISVVQPITSEGSTPQQIAEIHQAIEKLVPVAAAVLENVEQQEKEQAIESPSKPAVVGSEDKQKVEQSVQNNGLGSADEEGRNVAPGIIHKKPDSTSSEDANSTTLSEVEVTDAA